MVSRVRARSEDSSRRPRRGNAGGRASEGGSTYRAGLAAYLAAHGLAEAIVWAGDGVEPGSPTWLWFETAGAVDDVRCCFDTGHRWDVQAKRRCAWDPTFAEVVDQWVRAVREDELSDEDRLVLASGGLSGPLRHLGAASRRMRDGAASASLPREHEAYQRYGG